MKGFLLNQKGDVVMESGDISMIDGNNLLRQTVEKVIGTNNGEWFLNEDEGIDFRVILTKSPDRDAVRDEIADALLQVDTTFILQSFSMEIVERTLKIKFSAVNGDGEEIGGEAEYGA